MAERDWLYEMLEGMRQDQRDSLAQMRIDMNKGFDQMRDEMQIQNGRVRKSEDRLTIIETQRTEEDKQAVKRGVWAGLVASAGLTGVLKVLESVFHR